MRDQISGTSRLMSWSILYLGPRYPVLLSQPSYSVSANDTSALLRSVMGQSALNGAFVIAPSKPAPTVDGDLPGIDAMYSMKSSGSSR